MQREVPQVFDDIRCYGPQDLPQVFETLLADEQFCTLLARLYPGMDMTLIRSQVMQFKDILAFQQAFLYPLINRFIAQYTDGASLDATAIEDKSKAYTFISNHRDIVLDPAFLGVLLLENGFPTTQEIAIGDNLLVYPWIKHVVRLNKAFIVKRSLSLRETLRAGQLMSAYMHYVIREKQNPIWIAQREGRAKDSDDHTQESVLKMIALGGEGEIIDRLLEMNIVPMSLSYEYDPCDYLKAKEFQLKRDSLDYKKTKQDDLLNMQTGIMGYKGKVIFKMSPCINPWLEQQRHLPKTELFTALAQHLDEQIFKGYTFYPNNYIAADMLQGSEQRNAHYTPEQREHYIRYVEEQLAKIDIPNKDEDFLREKIWLMYANPLFNFEKLS